MIPEAFHLLIVGAGPAGLSAATMAAQVGLRVLIVDEYPAPGGRLPGQFHREHSQNWWIGKEDADRLIAACIDSDVVIRCGVSVYGMDRTTEGWHVATSAGPFHARRLLLATGASEVPLPVKGWTLPGVMSVGAAQVMANVNRVKPGRRGYIVGINVLGMAIAMELAAGGIELAGIVLPQRNELSQSESSPAAAMNTLFRLSAVAPSFWLRACGHAAGKARIARLAASCFPRSGMRIMGLPLRLRTAIVEIQGCEAVEAVTLADVDADGQIMPGSERQEEADFVALAGGLTPLAELASIAGCPFLYIPELGGYVPKHAETLRTPVDRLYVAGNITGVESAKVAMAQGELAAAVICADEGFLGNNAHERMRTAMQQVRRVRAESVIRFHPAITEAREMMYSQP